MKTLTTLLLTFLLVIACKGQPAINQCFSCYTQEQWDSLTMAKDAIINQKELVIAAQGEQIATQSAQIANQQAIINELSNPTDTAVFINSKISIKLVGDSTSVTIAKIGDRFNYQLVSGLHRVNLFYEDAELKQYWMYDTISYDTRLTRFAIPVK